LEKDEQAVLPLQLSRGDSVTIRIQKLEWGQLAADVEVRRPLPFFSDHCRATEQQDTLYQFSEHAERLPVID